MKLPRKSSITIEQIAEAYNSTFQALNAESPCDDEEFMRQFDVPDSPSKRDNDAPSHPPYSA